MNTEDFLDKIGESVVAVWSDGFECRDWGIVSALRKPVGKAVLGLAGVFFQVADVIRADQYDS